MLMFMHFLICFVLSNHAMQPACSSSWVLFWWSWIMMYEKQCNWSHLCTPLHLGLSGIHSKTRAEHLAPNLKKKKPRNVWSIQCDDSVCSSPPSETWTPEMIGRNQLVSIRLWFCMEISDDLHHKIMCTVPLDWCSISFGTKKRWKLSDENWERQRERE